MSGTAKTIRFCGGALGDLRAFPSSARREAGYQLDRVQNGRDPGDWKPMNTVGAGVRELRIREASGAFRVLYVARFADTIYVLHCFQKKTHPPERWISIWRRSDTAIWQRSWNDEQ